MKKKIIAVAGIAVLLILTAVLIIFNHPVKTENPQPTESSTASDVSEASEQSAEFDFVCTDRLCGCPETERHTTPDSIEVVFSDIGTIRKEYGSEKENGSEEDNFGESYEKEIISRVQMRFPFVGHVCSPPLGRPRDACVSHQVSLSIF